VYSQRKSSQAKKQNRSSLKIYKCNHNKLSQRSSKTETCFSKRRRKPRKLSFEANNSRSNWKTLNNRLKLRERKRKESMMRRSKRLLKRQSKCLKRHIKKFRLKISRKKRKGRNKKKKKDKKN